MSDHCRPIGFFDSGVGGVSVLKTASLYLPGENYIYYGDSANAPYGEKDEHTIKEMSMAAGRFLYEKGVKAIVVACNTATSAAIKMLRAAYSLPVISMEPAVKPALGAQREGKVMVLATPATVKQTRYLALLERLGDTQRVISVGCAGLAELIENEQIDETSIYAYLIDALKAYKDEDVRAAVLGCSHYSFAEKHIQSFLCKAYHKEISVFDGRYGTARQLVRVLTEHNQLCESDRKGSVNFYTSGNPEHIGIYRRLFEDFAQ